MKKPVQKSTSGKYRILWASKVSGQKYPELLIKIAKALDPERFQIDVYGRVDTGYSKKMFKNIPALRYHGAYNGIDSINLAQSNLFLYTSLTDGIPNAVLEIVARGLPIIASKSGGIGEVITPATGLLVDSQDAEKYVEAIEYASAHPQEMTKMAQEAQELLRDRHNWDNFLKDVKKGMVY